METIIQQMVTEMVEGIFEIALESNLKLASAVPKILGLLKRYAVEIVKFLIGMTNKALVEDKAGRRREARGFAV